MSTDGLGVLLARISLRNRTREKDIRGRNYLIRCFMNNIVMVINRYCIGHSYLYTYLYTGSILVRLRLRTSLDVAIYVDVLMYI